MKRCFVGMAFWGLGIVSGLSAGSVSLWPSEKLGVRAHPASQSQVDDAGRIWVKTGPGYSWPGVTVYYKGGKTEDLSAYGSISIALSNTTSKAQQIFLSVKNIAQQGQSPGGSVQVPAHSARELKVVLRNSPWVLDAPVELVGMRGFPAATGGSTFDIRKTAEFHIFNSPSEPRSFVVTGITLGTAGIQQKVLKADTFLPFVDQFGQFMHDDWPGKIHSEAELQASREKEAAWLAKHAESPISGANQYGGWKEGPQLKATGFFRVEKVNGKWWLVDPEGRLFFSHGVDCVCFGASTGVKWREKYFSWLPAEKGNPFSRFYGWNYWAPHGFYKGKGKHRTFDFAGANMLRKYGPEWEETARNMVHERIRAWGLNTIANWSDGRVYMMHKTPYTVCINTAGRVIEGSSGWWGKLRDPFSPEFAENLKKEMARQVKAGTVSDPYCIGYFVDNESSWGGNEYVLAVSSLISPASQPAKQAFVQTLKKKYGGIERLNQAWQVKHPDWEGLLACTNAPKVELAKADLVDFHRELVEKYFRTVSEAIHAAAPHRLYLGARIAWGAPVIYRSAAKYCDVVSVNIYNREVTRDLPEGSVDKPMINGEFHFGALDRGMFHTGLVATRDQAERAACYEAFVMDCLRHPRFVGTHWFQWRDQALTGRGDGENYQIGFLTVTDTPYPELVEAARRVAAKMYSVRYDTTSVR